MTNTNLVHVSLSTSLHSVKSVGENSPVHLRCAAHILTQIDKYIIDW